ncbi:hypothetical protein ES703_67695 [subsurface metagenome]
MPKKIKYPTRGMDIKTAIDLAKIIYKNGKTLKIKTFAELINMKETGGAFNIKINSLIKYGLIDKKGDEISITSIIKKLIHPMDDTEKRNLTFRAFKTMPLFEQLIEKFKDTDLPDDDQLKTLLIRQYNVNDKAAKSVRDGFIESLKYIGIFNEETREISQEFHEENDIDSFSDKIGHMISDNKAIKQKKAANQELTPITSIINKDVIDLIIIFASYLNPMNVSTEEIDEIIERN